MNRKNIEDILGLTPLQEGMLFHYLKSPENNQYFEQLSLDISGEIDREVFEKAWNFVIATNEMLRAQFRWGKLEKPVQIILKDHELQWEYYDLSGKESSQKNRRLKEITLKDRERGFDLREVPFRVTLCKIDEDKYEMIISNHHILYDGWSNGVILKEFFKAYIELSEGKEPVKLLKTKFQEFLKWNQAQPLDKQETFWTNYLKGFDMQTELSIKQKRKEKEITRTGDFRFSIAKDMQTGLENFVKKHKITLASFTYSVWGLLLGKYNNTGDVIFGTTVSNRNAKVQGIENIVGLFINTLPLRIQTNPNEKAVDFLYRIDKELQMREAYESTSLVNIKGYSEIDNKEELFDTILVIENYHFDSRLMQEKTNISVDSYTIVERTHYDLTLGVSILGGDIAVNIIYNRESFAEGSIVRLAGHFNNIFREMLENPGKEVLEVDTLQEEEKNRILYEFNNTNVDYSKDKTIHQLFEEQVDKTPTSIAVACKNNILTYNELNKKANRVANALRAKRVKPNHIVGIMLDPSIGLVVGILGILKAGAAYLSIDAEYPDCRKRNMMQDSHMEVLLTRRNDSPQAGYECEILDIEDPDLTNYGIQNPEHINQPNNLVYTIFTSGSTGKPKGTGVYHRGFLNLMNWFVESFEISACDSNLLLTSLSFDLTQKNIYAPLITGGTLYIPDENYYNPRGINRKIGREKLTWINCTPSIFYLLVDVEDEDELEELFSLRYVFLGGEPINVSQLVKCIDSAQFNAEIINTYGPTECTDICCSYRLRQPKDFIEKNVPLGKPVYNSQLFILDRYCRLQPIGVPGELCIGGEGVGIGYLNDRRLTAEKFITFSPKVHWKKRIYRTGDLARWQPDGNIDFIGRVDHQVKIRGFRVEPGEIESRLLNYDKIKKAIVMAVETKGGEVPDKSLCAYIVVDKEFNSPASELREYLLKELPAYMVPSYFITLEEFPLNPSGKIDQKSFPTPEESDKETGIEYDAPQNFMERKLVEVWEKVLGRNTIGVNDNFFLIGGDSIKSIQISAQMNKKGFQVEVRDILNNPTISRLAPFVRKICRIADQSEVIGAIPLTPIQKEFFSFPFAFPHHFNMSTVLYSRTGFEEELLRTIFTKIFEHHDVLRMVFKEHEGGIIQENRGTDSPLWLRVFYYRNLKDGRTAFEVKSNEIQASLDLAGGPLMKLGLFHMNDGDRLLIVLHHLVIDGVSWRILFEDIETLHQQYTKKEPLKLPLKTGSYKCWSEKLSEYANTPSFLKEKAYWAQLGLTKVPALKRDFNEENNCIKDIGLLSFRLDVEETNRLLTKVNHAFNTEINDILLTALGLGLKKIFGNNRFLIALEGHGREKIFRDLEVNRTLGWFTAKYPVVLNLSYENDLARQIKEIKEILHRVPNKGVGYGVLRYLTDDQYMSGINFELEPQIIFNYEGQFDAESEQLSVAVIEEPITNSMDPEEQRSIDFNISGIIAKKQLLMSITYNKKQYKWETIKDLWCNYENSLKQIIDFCSAREEKELTPCDFTYKKLPLEVVERLRNQYAIKDIYRLSPMQEGMLFHALKGDHASTYLEQISYRIHGELDMFFVKKSLNELFKRHEVLRTVFFHERLDSPIQIVLEERQVEFYYKDIRHIVTENEKNKFIKEFKETDRHRTFDLNKDVLSRFSVFQVTDSEYEFVWSFHHILLDGWSVGIINEEFFKIYKSFLDNRTYRLSASKSFRVYIQWLESRRKEDSRRFWANYLSGYKESTFIPRTKSHTLKSADERYINEKAVWVLEREKTRSLDKLAGENRVTLNTVIKTVWGLVLGKNSGKNDVVFGIVVSGRPPEIDDVELMVGCFINTIPFRVRYNGNTKFRNLLQVVQLEAVESESHHYYPLAEIQAETQLNQYLLDHLLVFENYPVAERIDGVVGRSGGNPGGMKLKITDVEIFEQPNYDFYIMLLPGEELTIVLKYNAAVYEKELINKLGDQYLNALQQVSNNREININELQFLTEEKRKKILTLFNDGLDNLENE